MTCCASGLKPQKEVIMTSLREELLKTFKKYNKGYDPLSAASIVRDLLNALDNDDFIEKAVDFCARNIVSYEDPHGNYVGGGYTRTEDNEEKGVRLIFSEVNYLPDEPEDYL